MAVCLTAFEEFAFEMIHLVDEFLSHRFSQGVAFASGEVGKQSGEEHDLLLIYGHAICIFEVFLHHRYIVDNGLFAMFSVDEVGDISHWSGTVEGVHGDKVLKY